MARHPSISIPATKGNPAKTVEITGSAEIEEMQDGALRILPADGTVSVIVQQARGWGIWIYHPLAGWHQPTAQSFFMDDPEDAA